LVPVTALLKETSTVAFVSKLSDRLQHAAFSNSFLSILNINPASFLLSEVAAFEAVTVTPSILYSWWLFEAA
jgi:hypothetical protein